jgi:hypothetical protein
VKLVEKYAVKQEEKTIIRQEEVFVRSINRDLFDSDIFDDFELLYANNCYVINEIKGIPAKNADGFRKAMDNILKFVQE